MRKIVLFIVFISLISVVSYASSVSITTVKIQSQSGALTTVYFETSGGVTSSTPSTNTATSPTASGGSYTISRGSTDYIYSPRFAYATAISAGNWILDLWVASSGSGSMSVAITVVSSSGTVVSTIVSSASTQTIGSSKVQLIASFTTAQTTIPSGDYLRLALTAPTGTGRPSFTVDWGSTDATNLQVPTVTLSS